jgi:hypothetical protein
VTPIVLPAVPRAVATPVARPPAARPPIVRPLVEAVRLPRPVLLPREVLPYGGANLWVPLASGIALISLGVVLRRMGAKT